MTPYFSLLTDIEKRLPLFLKGIGIRNSQEKVFRPQGFPDYHYLHTLEGKGELIVNNQTFIIDENQGFFFYPNVPHEYYRVGNKWSTIWLTFNGPAVQSILNALKISNFEVFDLSNKPTLEGILFTIYHKVKNQNYITNIECSHLIYNFILNLAIAVENKIDMNFKGNYIRLSPVLKFIEENYQFEITLEDISNIINLSPQHLCNLFKKTFNITPYEYLIKVRIQKAKELLIKENDIQIKKVCFDVGFRNLSYFSYMFKKIEGVTPSEFKKLFL